MNNEEPIEISKIADYCDGKLTDDSINVILNIKGVKTGLHLPVDKELLEALKPATIIGYEAEKKQCRLQIYSTFADAFMEAFKLHFKKVQKNEA